MKLTVEGQKAKDLVDRLCECISRISGREFFAEMTYEPSDKTFEGHIIDSGRYFEDKNGNLVLADEGEEIGMIFWGGYFSLDRYEDAESRAWMSLLDDCIGLCDEKEIVGIHNLTEALKDFGPCIDVNFKSITELENFLNSKNV